MIGHRQFAILAAGAIDFSLAPADQARLDRHLASCADCRDVAWRLRSDASAIEQRPRHLPPPGMRERFERDWLPRTGATRRPSLRLGLVAAAALLSVGALTVAVGGRLLTNVPMPASTPTPSPTDSTATPVPPPVGTSTVIDLSRGPVNVDMVCSYVLETGCATDVLAAFDTIWTTATNRIVRLDPATGAVVAEVDTGSYPIRLAADDGFVWVTLRGPARLIRIDPAANQIDASFELSGAPSGVVESHGSIWVVDEIADALVQIDPNDGAVLGTIPVPDTPWEVAATSDALWVTDRLGIKLTEIDPVAGRVVATRPVPGALPTNMWDYGDGVVTDGDAVWVASGSRVSRYDPASQTFAGEPMLVFSHLAARDGRLWLAAGGSVLVRELDPMTLAMLAEQNLDVSGPSLGGDWETSIAASDEALWVRSYESGRIVRIEIGD